MAGPKPYLNAEEENELGQLLKSCASVGFGKTRRDAMHIAKAVVREKGTLKKETIYNTWMVESLSLKTRRPLT